MARAERKRKATLKLVVAYAVPAAAAAAMIVYGILTPGVAWTLGGLVGLVVIAATAPVAFQLARLGSGVREMAQLRRTLDEIRGHTMLSDNAKRLLFRERELQLLRDAIEDDIRRGDYNAAVALCDEMAGAFGYRQEAEAFRSRINQERRQHYELEIQAALDQLDASLVEHDWATVHQHAARIRRLYPDSHLVGDLDRRIENARLGHKMEIESRFLEAAERDDVEAAMDLLRQLDRYLSREEAERLSEVAAGVIAKHRENLGTLFRRAVSEHRWEQAVQVGETISAQYPNSKMADEVRSMIDVLRTRAAGGGVATEQDVT